MSARAVLRGDFGRIVMERGANLQETAVVHSFPDVGVVVERPAISAMAPCCMAAGSAATPWSA